MATEWMPLTRFEPRSWLLANGEIVTEPPLEQTATGRKIRVVGTKESFFANSLDDLLWQAAQTVANEKNTKVVMEVMSPVQTAAMEASALGFSPGDSGTAKAHMIHDPGTAGARTQVWWRFKHPVLPIEATLGVQIVAYPVGTQPSRQVINVHLSVPMMAGYGGSLSRATVAITGATFHGFVESLPNHLQYPWREFIRDHPVTTWPTEELVAGDYIGTAHKAVKRLLGLVRKFESLDSIQIPDITNIDEPGWLELELYETNVNAEFVSDLTEWIDSNPAVEGILNAYRNLLDQMAQSGFTVQDKTENDFLAALLSGDKASMHMTVHNVLDPVSEGMDREHTVSIHLPSGTFVVECTHQHVDRGEVAEKWEEAMLIAKMTGQEDVLVEYARKAAEDRVQGASKKLVKSRK